MARIVILGGYGYAGRLLAAHLLERSGAEIVLAGRHLEKAQAYAEKLNAGFRQTSPVYTGPQPAGERVSAVRADAASMQDLRLALAGADLLVVAAPVTQHADTVVHAALGAGVDYLDIQLSAQKLALLRSLAPEIERSGRCFITEAGFHPGLPAAMVRAAAAQLDRLDAAIVGGYLNIGRQTPYSEAVDELMEAFVDYQAQVFKDGSWTKPGSWSTRRIDFGREIGERRCVSMFFEELRDLPVMIPTLRETGFYISETHWLVDWVITAIVFAGLKIAPRRGIRPLLVEPLRLFRNIEEMGAQVSRRIQ